MSRRIYFEESEECKLALIGKHGLQSCSVFSFLFPGLVLLAFKVIFFQKLAEICNVLCCYK